MSARAENLVSPAAVNAWLISAIGAAAVAFGVLLSGFVINEPAPYEIYMAGLVAAWALFGLRISRAVAPLVALFALYTIGGLFAMTQMEKIGGTPLYLAVTLFLALTSVFYAAVIEATPSLYKVIFNAWVAAALPTALLGILGYFHAFPGADLFTRYDRASGAFQDPNVFGPFLALPAVYLLYRSLTEGPARLLFSAIPLVIIVGGIFLSFSRGAWGLFILASAMMTAGLFFHSRSGRLRLRILAMALVALALLCLAFLIALQIPSVSDLFFARAQIEQDYDTARLGRFARYGIGFLLAMQRPLGIGPLVFGQVYGEDTHNIWLKALMDYGWLGFAAFVTLVVWTLAAGFRILFRNRPWQPYLLCAYVVFVGHIGLGTVIDMDHWRHFYLLIGLVWGAIALEARHQRSARRMAARDWGLRPNPGAYKASRGSERSAAR